ncbi:MAG TPA: STAS/SEC14 domain-containing protein [Solirubrobacterales bacterium]|nr:STAS/SEC14 domain-containing protein [Solirubrobacterales bacterium]
MIERIDDMPAGTVGFRLEGSLSDADYTDVLTPGLREAAAEGEVRLMIVGAEGFDLGSLKSRFEEARQDPDLNLGHRKDWRRVAIVADANFVLRRSFSVFSRVISVEMKLFSLKDQPEARTWIKG